MANPAARNIALAAALLTAGCGLAHHDVTVAANFTAGGGPPTATHSIEASDLIAPLRASAGDLSKLSSVTLQSAHLSATDTGDLVFVSGATLTVSASGFPDVTVATLPAAPGAGQTDVALSVDSKTDLRPYLAANGELHAEVTYAAQPAVARGLRLTLVVRGSL